MTPTRLFAVFLIFVCASAAWVVLGTANVIRTDDKSSTLVRQVGDLWGEPQVQEAPVFARQAEAAGSGAKAGAVTKAGSGARPGTAAKQGSDTKPGAGVLDIAGTDIDATFDLQPRRKGLLWYATYGVDFKAAYRVTNPDSHVVGATMTLRFPTSNGVYDGFAVNVDGKDVPVTVRDGQAVAAFQMAPDSTATVKTGYVTQGLNEWRYQPTTGAVGVIRDLRVTMRTNFAQVDYPVDAVSPSKSEAVKGGMVLTWDYTSLVSGRPIAVVMPKPTNPGPLASRISYFAPVSLLFFFAALILLTSTSAVKLHPVHYGFLAAAFFAFQLLFSYLVDRVDLNLSFAIAALASIALVVGYLSIVVGRTRVLLEIAASQFVFLVLFSYSFFFEGLTGLAIAIGSVVTLGYFMVRTAYVDWDALFHRPPRATQVGGYSAPVVPRPAVVIPTPPSA